MWLIRYASVICKLVEVIIMTYARIVFLCIPFGRHSVLHHRLHVHYKSVEMLGLECTEESNILHPLYLYMVTCKYNYKRPHHLQECVAHRHRSYYKQYRHHYSAACTDSESKSR